MFYFNNKYEFPGLERSFGTGWLPPTPDLRDYTEKDKDIPKMVKQLGIVESLKFSLPISIDLRQWCTPVEDQGGIGSCTAQAAVGAVEYYENRAFNRYINGSRLFVYKTTRNLLGLTGDTGAWLRNTMGALALLGVPPENFWQYTDGPTFDNEPSAFVYSLADDYQATRYFSHDPIGSNIPKDRLLLRIKAFLAAGVPVMFGFYGFPSFKNTTNKGEVPFPCPGESAIFGHAVLAVGYHDTKTISNPMCNTKTKGALLIRNSWGVGWGDQGYGWLPYEYVMHGLAVDFWSLLKMDWVDTKNFGI